MMKIFATLRISVMDELPVVMLYTIQIINILLLQLASLYFGPFKHKKHWVFLMTSSKSAGSVTPISRQTIVSKYQSSHVTDSNRGAMTQQGR